MPKEESENQMLVKIFFQTTESNKNLGKIIVEHNDKGESFCIRCGDWFKDNSGHDNLLNHIKNAHNDWAIKLEEQKRVGHEPWISLLK